MSKKTSQTILITIILFLTIILIPIQNTYAQLYPGSACVGGGEPCLPYPGDSRAVACRVQGTGAIATNGQAGYCTIENASGIYGLANPTVRSAQENFIRGDLYLGNKTGNKGVIAIMNDALGDLPASPQGGMQAVLGYMTAMYTTRPASSAEAIADFKESLGVKRAYAQGYAFGALTPILDLWKLTRNIALGGFVIIFVTIGIMLILRTHIDPRTVITVQQALPQIIISLMLVIFSYAFIGLLIDSVTVLTRIGATILQQSGYLAAVPAGSDQATRQRALDRALNANIFSLYNQLFNVDQLVAGYANLEWASNTINQILIVDQFLRGGITRTVLWIAMFVAVIRTFFMLLQSYLAITFTVIVSPLQFLFFALPGQSGKFGDWFRNLMSHLLVFPVVFFMLAFAAIFYAQPGNVVWMTQPDRWNLDNIWSVGTPAFNNQTSFWAPPGFGDWSGIVGPLLTLAILLTTPKAINITRELVHPKYRPSAAEGEASTNILKAAARIPMLGSFTRA